ncbi:MAX gene-associated protein isoform X1 [Gracilinanus agilis]|uniref:MAX gene-associated protein isoform X1 n=1 Tax=Gracilinanus agilis TaxID=191870 RepID=UPI001CFDCB23|nr:MAX gene-associated protein isoform X1 [Gracilinanus agilis]
MEQQQVTLGNQDGGTVSGTAPAFFVILKQQQGSNKTDQGILVANRDACALASSVSSPVKTKVKTCLPADCTSGGITVTLDNNSMWNEFYHRSTEMILTKQGRRMFPYCRYWITGLNSNLKYLLVMDITPVDNHRYKWNGRWWEPSGKAEPHVLGRVFIHPESPSTGHYWMHQPVSFYKLKLTNNTLDPEGHIILHSMHRYLPRLHVVPAEKNSDFVRLTGPGVRTFTFPQTEFFAVTAYQNIQITQLKIDYNPFAKGFRDDGLNSKPQRDVRQKNSSDQEGSSVPSSPGYRGHLTESDGSEIQQSVPDPELSGHEPSEVDLEKASFNAERDFLGFLDSGLTPDEIPQLKQEASESPIASSFEDNSHVTSPLNPNENFNVVIKEEPLDEYDYELGMCPEGVTVKQEDTDEETDVYSNSDDEPILEKQLRRHGEIDDPEVDHSAKRPLSSPSGVAKAKMLKLDSGKMPVVYLEPCAVTKSTVKISELPENMFSQSRKEKSPVLTELDFLPAYMENSRKSSFCLPREIEKELRKQPLELRAPQKYSSLKESEWKYPDLDDNISISKTLSNNPKSLDGDFFSEKDDLGRKRTTILKITGAPKASSTTQNITSNVPGKRGRPRKFKLSKAGRPPKSTGKSVTANKTTPVGSGNTFPDVKPDLEDVDGVLFVSFASKEALDIHTVDRAVDEPTSLQDSATSDPGHRARICQLEQELLEDLKSLRHKQVIHPGLQEVGLKLNSVDPTMSIDLQYLGVQLPLAPATSFPLWNLGGTNPGSPDTGLPFVSRTGKTNDFTKIKGWRGKFHNASSSKNEGSSSESSLKNRSAFCSDKLDEYLENEGKLMETSMGFSSNAPTSPVVYQLPTKSTSYVRTLDSVLKKQSTVTPSTSYTLKPHPVTSVSRKTKSLNRQAVSSGRTKSSFKPILPSPVSPKQKSSHSVPGDKATKASPNSMSESQGENLTVPATDENVLPKQINLRQAHHQQHPATRPPGLSKTQVKLMDLEDCALWEGKPRTYITEERADVSLTTLLTAQASLKTKPIHKIIKKRAPPCNNDFCRLGCICASLALEKRQPAHCRRPDCMFGCTCLKRKVVLVKGRSKKKRFLRKTARRDSIFSGPVGEQKKEGGKDVTREEDRLKEKKRRKKVEYTICDTEPEQPIRHYPLWVKVEGEVDPEPVYIPTPSVVEPVKPTVSPHPEILPTSSKNKLTNGVKPVRVYTPKPNPVIREEDKDPVYLYFESMMTCARVRVYERKLEEGEQPSPLRQQNSCQSSTKNCSSKEHDSEHQSMKQNTYDMEKDTDKSGEKSWRSSCNEGESSSTSYMHQTSPGGPTKLIEIISDCNWEEDRNKILSILSQHINSNMPPQSLKVGSFIIELASQRKSRGEKNPPIYSSRVKISMPSCQDQDDTAENSDSETPDGSPLHRKMDDTTFEQTNALEALREKLHGGKALPFYAGLSPAGKLVAYKQKPSSKTSGLIEVASNAKVAASRIPRTQVPSPSISQTMSSSTTTTSTMTTLKAFVPAQRPIAVRPSPGGVFTQFVMSKVGALQQKIPGVSTPQPLTGPQKFSIRPSPVMVVTPVVSSKPSQVCNLVTEPVTTTTPQVSLESITTVTSPVTAVSSLGTKETTTPSGSTSSGTLEISETSISTPITPTLPSTTVNVTKATGIAAPITTIALPKSVVSSPTITLPVASTASTSVVIVTTAASSSVVTTPTSSLGSVPIILSGINASPPVSQRPENAPQIPVATSPVSPSPEKRAGPRLLLIPVQQGSPGLRPLQNMQLVQGQRMLLQPVRSPSGMNLFRHPNGQIVQLVPLQQVRGSSTQPNLQPVMLRNPGSAVGIRLPAPSKPPETPPSSASPSTFPTISPMIQTVGSSPPMNLITQASSVLSTVPSFVSQAGTLTLRISPPGAGSFASQTGSESKITYSSGGQPVGTASLIPLQSGSFALLQLPGQKPVPNSIIQHVASLQMKRESQNLDQKEETNSLKQHNHKKALLHSLEGDVTETEAPLTDTVKQEQTATASEVAPKDLQEGGGSPANKGQEDIPADVISSDHSYISGSRTNEGNKEVNEEKENCNSSHSEEKVNEIPEDKQNHQEVNNKAVQTTNDVQLKNSSVQGETSQLGSVNEEQEDIKNPEVKLMNSEFSDSLKEDKSRSKVGQEEVTEQPEAKKDCGTSIEKRSTIRENQENHLRENLIQKCDGISREHMQAGEEHMTEGPGTSQENSNVLDQKQGSSDLLEENELTKNTRSFNVECDTWNKIPNSAPLSVPQVVDRAQKEDKVIQSHLLLPGEQIQHLKQRKKSGRTVVDLPVSDVEEEEEEEEEEEKTDDSADDMVDGISDYHSEEVEEVEKNNSMDYTEEEEQIDIETVEEYSEKINIARLKATAAHIRSPKQPGHSHVLLEERAPEKSRKDSQIPVKLKPEFWNEKLQKEAEAFAYYRRTHTANERRRRGEMRDLFEKLKITLGLLHSSKVSKSLILTRAFGEIQGLTDQADKLIGQKNLLTRKRNNLIRKVSSLSGKTEEVVLKKLEYIYAKQQALEAQKKKKKMDQDEPSMPPRAVKQQEGASTSVELGQVVMTSRRGKPLILARKRGQSTEKISPSHTIHNTASLVMTPQGQVLTLKGPLVSGPMVTVSPALLQSELKPQVTNSAVVQQESDDLFMMPRIVNVTSLATDGGLGLDVDASKHPHEAPPAKTPDQTLKETIRNENTSFEDLTRISSGNNHGDGRTVPRQAQDFVENKDISFPQIVNVSSVQAPLETFSRKISGGIVSGNQCRRKETELGGERLKLKEIPFRKLQVKDLKDSNIETELRKVASAIEEATLDPTELLSSMEEEDDTDETLTSLLNEITFLNQQLNDDSSSMTELPSSIGTEFPRLANARRAVVSKLASGNRATFQLGTLGSSLKELPEVQEASGSISPLLLHLEDDDLAEGERQPTETDVLKIVIDPEIKESFPSQRRASDTGKMTSSLPAESENMSSPPILHMKTGQESSSTDTLWRPMPKLAPLGLKLANPPSDVDGQSLKVMPCLAPIVAKGGPVGLKTTVPGHNDQEGQENKVMPTLAPVVAKMSNSGSSSSSSGK